MPAAGRCFHGNAGPPADGPSPAAYQHEAPYADYELAEAPATGLFEVGYYPVWWHAAGSESLRGLPLFRRTAFSERDPHRLAERRLQRGFDHQGFSGHLARSIRRRATSSGRP